MEVVHQHCCGIDVHQASLTVCVSIKEDGRTEKYKLCCGTTTAELLRLTDWLKGHQVTHVAMEATGVSPENSERDERPGVPTADADYAAG